METIFNWFKPDAPSLMNSRNESVELTGRLEQSSAKEDATNFRGKVTTTHDKKDL